MHRDARSLEPGWQGECDVCIIGSGVAGFAAASGLKGSGLNVIVLESGGFEDRAADNALSIFSTSSTAFVSDFQTSRRQVGGNANAWYIQARPQQRWLRLAVFTETDFEGHCSGDTLGWPVDYQDYLTWIARAQDVFGLAPDRSYAPLKSGAGGALVSDEIETRCFQFGHADALLGRMHHFYRADPDTVVLTHAYATELVTDPNSKWIETVSFAREDGQRHSVRARLFILAGGGAAITQLLLASRQHTPNGIGNDHDTVGRWMMDHPLIRGGAFHPAHPDFFRTAPAYDMTERDGAPDMGFLAPTPAYQSQRKDIALNCLLYPVNASQPPRRLSKRQADGVGAISGVATQIKRRQWPDVPKLLDAIKGIDGIAYATFDALFRPPVYGLGHGGWSTTPERHFDYFDVLHSAEQKAHRDNRLQLSPELDRFGVPKLSFDWNWREDDAADVRRAQEGLADAIARAGWGRFELRSVDGKPDVMGYSSRHFMGTTRLSRRPEDGVVTPEARVHGIDNLFINSSSIFPSGGYANPTLSIVAFGLRLAAHIQTLLQTPGLPSSANPDFSGG